MLKPRPPTGRVSPDYPHHPSSVPCPLPRRIEQVHMSIATLPMQPSPFLGRVGIRIITFEACLDFTRVTARWIAQPPKAAFVTRLRTGQLPNRSARQLPDQSTTLWVEPSSTGDTRLRGAPRKLGFDLSGVGDSRPPPGPLAGSSAPGWVSKLAGERVWRKRHTYGEFVLRRI
jgi:hypothetical protein